MRSISRTMIGLLFGGGAVRGQAELRLHVLQLAVCFFHTSPRNRPEVRRIVGDEGQLDGLLRLAGAGAAPAAGAHAYQTSDDHPHPPEDPLVHGGLEYHETDVSSEG